MENPNTGPTASQGSESDEWGSITNQTGEDSNLSQPVSEKDLKEYDEIIDRYGQKDENSEKTPEYALEHLNQEIAEIDAEIEKMNRTYGSDVDKEKKEAIAEKTEEKRKRDILQKVLKEKKEYNELIDKYGTPDEAIKHLNEESTRIGLKAMDDYEWFTYAGSGSDSDSTNKYKSLSEYYDTERKIALVKRNMGKAAYKDVVNATTPDSAQGAAPDSSAQNTTPEPNAQSVEDSPSPELSDEEKEKVKKLLERAQAPIKKFDEKGRDKLSDKESALYGRFYFVCLRLGDYLESPDKVSLPDIIEYLKLAEEEYERFTENNDAKEAGEPKNPSEVQLEKLEKLGYKDGEDVVEFLKNIKKFTEKTEENIKNGTATPEDLAKYKEYKNFLDSEFREIEDTDSDKIDEARKKADGVAVLLNRQQDEHFFTEYDTPRLDKMSKFLKDFKKELEGLSEKDKRARIEQKRKEIQNKIEELEKQGRENLGEDGEIALRLLKEVDLPMFNNEYPKKKEKEPIDSNKFKIELDLAGDGHAAVEEFIKEKTGENTRRSIYSKIFGTLPRVFRRRRWEKILHNGGKVDGKDVRKIIEERQDKAIQDQVKKHFTEVQNNIKDKDKPTAEKLEIDLTVFATNARKAKNIESVKQELKELREKYEDSETTRNYFEIADAIIKLKDQKLSMDRVNFGFRKLRSALREGMSKKQIDATNKILFELGNKS